VSYFKSNNGVYIIAEIGGNHEGDFESAKKLAKLAAESGVDAVKFQIYTGDALVNNRYDPDRNKHFKKFELTEGQYIELAKKCKELGVIFMASVWDIDAFEFIYDYISIYKIGSGDMTAYNIINKIALTGKPIILSTGLATLEEINYVVDFIESIDGSYIAEKKLSILQCTSMYPIPFEDANLNVMQTYRDNFNIPIGYSDHTIGMDAVEIAVAMGAEIIEVHFTDSRVDREFRDHKVSVTKEEIQALLKRIQKIKKIQGSFEKKPTQSEIKTGHIKSFRRGVYANTDLKAGNIIMENDLITLRPQIGIGSEKFFDIIGNKLKVDIERLGSISNEDFVKKM